MSYSLTFDGHDIGSAFLVERHVVRQLGSWQPSLVDVPGRDGSAFVGTRRAATEVQMDVYAIDGTRSGRQDAMRQLAAWLAVDEPKPLWLGDEGPLYRLAVPTAQGELSALLDADHVTLTFACPDPRLYGPEHTISVTSGTAFGILGTAPTEPTISVTGATRSGTYWRCVDETGAGIYVTLGTGTHTIVADCAARTLKVDGAVTALHPSYDWPSWGAGEHTLTVTGGGSVSVTYQERWW